MMKKALIATLYLLVNVFTRIFISPLTPASCRFIRHMFHNTLWKPLAKARF